MPLSCAICMVSVGPPRTTLADLLSRGLYCWRVWWLGRTAIISRKPVPIEFRREKRNPGMPGQTARLPAAPPVQRHLLLLRTQDTVYGRACARTVEVRQAGRGWHGFWFEATRGTVSRHHDSSKQPRTEQDSVRTAENNIAPRPRQQGLTAWAAERGTYVVWYHMGCRYYHILYVVWDGTVRESRYGMVSLDAHGLQSTRQNGPWPLGCCPGPSLSGAAPLQQSLLFQSLAPSPLNAPILIRRPSWVVPYQYTTCSTGMVLPSILPPPVPVLRTDRRLPALSAGVGHA